MRMDWGFVVLGFVLLAIGHGLGLFWVPPEATMGETGRIFYVHVPTAWNCLVMFLVAFVCAVMMLWTGNRTWDARATGYVEVGTVLNVMLLYQGSIWAKPTWGVYWTWDPRLTTAAVMATTFAGVLVLRKLVEDVERRATAFSVATIIAFVNVPVVYFSVKWWRTLHQDMSSPSTVDQIMHWPLRTSAFGMLFLGIGLAMLRANIERKRIAIEDEAPDLPPVPTPLEI